MSLLDVEHAIKKANVLVPSGSLRTGQFEFDVFSNAQMTTKEEVENVVIKMADPGLGTNDIPVAIRVKTWGSSPTRTASRVRSCTWTGSGRCTCACTSSRRQHDHDGRSAQRGAAGSLRRATRVKLETTFEQSTYIENAIHSLQVDAILGASIVMIVLLLFLGNFSSTLIAGLSLPLAFMATLAAMYLGGETLNVFTLGGLALAIGRLIDNAIIVLEVIHRHQHEGKPPLQAALDGTREVAAPVLAGTLTTVIVFVPVWFLTGISKYLFTPMGLTISVAMVASYVVSLTVIPVLMRRFSEKAPKNPNPLSRLSNGIFARTQRALDRLDDRYGRVLARAMKRKGAVLTVVAMAFFGSLALATQIGADFFPPIDEGEFRVKVRAPIGTNVEESEKIALRIQELVEEEIPEDVLVGTNTSIGAAKAGLRAMLAANSGGHEVTLRVELTPPGQREHDMEYYIARLRKRAANEFPGISVVFVPRGTVRQIINFGYKAPIVVEVRGYDLKTGSELAKKIDNAMQTVPGISDVKTVPAG